MHSGPFGYPAKFAGVRRRPPLPWYVHSGPFGYSASFPAPAGAGLFYVLIGISVRLHLAFASGFLSVCEGKGLYVRRACQYVILRISSPRAHGRNVHFTGALFAAYQRRMLPRVFSKSTSRKQSFTSQLTLRRSGFSGGGGETKAGYTLRRSSTCTRLFAFRVQCLAS